MITELPLRSVVVETAATSYLLSTSMFVEQKENLTAHAILECGGVRYK
jgi:hypothetical protein